MAQCKAFSKGGTPCKNPASGGSKYCHLHRRQRRTRIVGISAGVGIALTTLGVIANIAQLLDFVGITLLPTQTPKPISISVISDVLISPPNPQANQPVTATFRLKNESDHVAFIQQVRAAVRGPNACILKWKGQIFDFPVAKNVIIQPGGEFTYSETRTFDKPGDYFAEPVKLGVDGRWGGIQPSPRAWFNVEDPATGNVPLPNCLIVEELQLSTMRALVGQQLTASFRVRNNTYDMIVIKLLAFAGRDTNARQGAWDIPIIYFPTNAEIILQPNQEYLYRESFAFSKPGNYSLEPVWMNIENRWAGIWPWHLIHVEVMTSP